MRTIPEHVITPRRLQAGSRVALIAPAGPIDDARLTSALAMCSQLGLEPSIGQTASWRSGYLAGSDELRSEDIRAAIRDPSIDAIWALRGGYGTARLLDDVDFAALREARKSYIGFSDNTSVLLALARLGFVSFHAPHAGGDFPAFAERWFRRMLFDGSPVTLDTPPGDPLQSWSAGEAEGRLAGGNLAVVAAAEGTRYAIPSDGAILFLEDISEPPYKIDRLVTQLRLSGALSRVAGIVVGQFTDCDSPAVSAMDVLRSELGGLGVPIIANAPIGHVPDNWTLPVGARVRIRASAVEASLSILEAVNE